MSAVNILSEEFAMAAVAAGLRARESALAAGHPVVFMDGFGRYVKELLDGRLLRSVFSPERQGNLTFLS